MSNAGSATRVIGGVLIALLFMLYSCSATCPSREISSSLDLNKFAVEWHVAATSMQEVRCAYFSVNETSNDSFTASFRVLTNNGSFSYILKGERGNDILGNFASIEEVHVKGPVAYRFVAVDYSSYVTMIVCNSAAEPPTNGFGIILSKEKTLESNVLNRLKNQLQTPFPGETVVAIDHSNLPCSPSL